jgi:PAS domain S-box-containing protein
VPMSRALRGESFQGMEVRLRRRDSGRTWWGSYNGGALRDARGRVSAALISMRDVTERRDAEAALRASEERYRATVTRAGVPIMLHADDGEVLAVSDGLLRATGYTRGQLARFEGWLALAYGERAAEIGARVARRFREGLPIPGVELPVRTAAGEVRTWVWTAPAPEPLPDGRRCIFAIGSDVTERHRAEAALRASEERYRLAAAAVDGVVYDWDLATGLVQRSEQAGALLGMAMERMPAEAAWWTARVHPDDLARLMPEVRALWEGDRPNHRFEYRLRHADGRWVDVVDHNFVVRDAAGKPVRIVGVTSDISARKRAEAALRASTTRLELAVGAGRMGVWDWDLATPAAFWDEAQCRIFGVDPDRFVPTLDAIWAMTHPDDRARLQGLADHALATGEPYRTEFRIVRPDGEVRWCVGGVAVTLDEGGRAARVSGITYDVTDVKRAEAELQATVDQRDRLLQELNHRVKNNLQLVTSLLQLQAGRSGEPAVQAFVEGASKRIQAIAQAHGLLHRGEFTGRLELGGYLRDLCGQLAASFRDPAGRGALEVEAAAATVDIDRAVPLGLIVNELVTNAFKHGLAGGGAGSTVRVHFRQLADGNWRLSVTDDGGGGGAARPPPVAAGRPTGLGLQLVELFGRQLGGTVRVSAQPRYRVEVDFPL